MPALPRDALGLGLRPRHHAYLFEHWPKDVDYFEIISENFMTDAARPRHNLARVRARYPIVLHGVGLDLLGHAPLDERYLDALARLADSVDAPFVSDHVCWSGAHGARHHDLLPTPHTDAVVDHAVERAARVQARLGRPFALENLSSYVEFAASTMTEWEFYTRIVTQAGCWFMLDINNVYVSSVNHGFDPLEYLDAIDLSRVVQVHLAGHRREGDGLIVDTHDDHVCDEVWRLYAAAWRRGGPFPTLLEWDAAIPDMPVLLAELERGRVIRRQIERRAGGAGRMTIEAWLAEFQREFGDVIRTPLDPGSGSLRARVDRYAEGVARGVQPSDGARERLAVYNRQYWFRLFGVLHDDFRLTTLLVGPWQMNAWATSFWGERAPSHFDLGRATEGFVDFLREHAPEQVALGRERVPLPRRALLQAAGIDEARQQVLLAPDEPVLALGPADIPRLQRSRLVPARRFAIVDEDWPLIELGRAHASTLPEQPQPLPLAHVEGRHSWALIGGVQGHRTIPLARLHARLLRELMQHPLPVALARVEAECSAAQRDELVANTQVWLAESVRLGCWRELEVCA